MLTVNKLEKIMELEESLRSEYQGKLDTQATELERLQTELSEQKAELSGTINQQLETISELSKKAATNSNFEQQNRELSNRSEKLQEEAATMKKRVKGLQQDLAEDRGKLKELTQYDPLKMKKNLDATKKKLAEKNGANDLLQKSLNKVRGEKAELEQKLKELESKLEELQPEAESETEEEAA